MTSKRAAATLRIARIVICIVSCTALAGCSLIEPSAARTNSAYRAKAVKASQSANSAVQTTLIAIQLIQRHRVTANVASVQVSDAADEATGAHHAFDRAQSPSVVSDEVQTNLDNMLNNVDSALSSLSTAVHRDDFNGLNDDVTELQNLSNELQQFEDANQ